MAQSAVETAARPESLEFVFYVDEDDFSIYAAEMPNTRYRVRQGPRQMQPQNWNDAYEWSSGEIIMMAADDLIFRTEGWDDRVRETFARFPDRIVLAWADDRMPGDRRTVQATHPFVHRRWVETVGYFCPPYFDVFWSDQWLQEVADRIRRRVEMEDVIIEHVHFTGGRAEFDSTYREATQRDDIARLKAIWDQTSAKRAEDAWKLEEAIAGHINEADREGAREAVAGQGR